MDTHGIWWRPIELHGFPLRSMEFHWARWTSVASVHFSCVTPPKPQPSWANAPECIAQGHPEVFLPLMLWAIGPHNIDQCMEKHLVIPFSPWLNSWKWCEWVFGVLESWGSPGPPHSRWAAGGWTGGGQGLSSGSSWKKREAPPREMRIC